MKLAMLAACLLACGSIAHAQDNILGLLSLPEVFGADACDRFTPEELPLYEAPDTGSLVGSIHVAEYWTFHDDGGCAGLRVNVHKTGAPEARELPTREYAYEAPGAMVLEQRGGWFKVRLDDGVAWLRPSARAEYHSLESLLTDGLTYLTDAWDRRLATSPGTVGEAARGPMSSSPSVRVVEFRRHGGRLWLRIEVLSGSMCESGEEPQVTSRGWIRAHALSGEPTVWFYSRGC